VLARQVGGSSVKPTYARRGTYATMLRVQRENACAKRAYVVQEAVYAVYAAVRQNTACNGGSARAEVNINRKRGSVWYKAGKGQWHVCVCRRKVAKACTVRQREEIHKSNCRWWHNPAGRTAEAGRATRDMGGIMGQASRAGIQASSRKGRSQAADPCSGVV